MYMIKCEQQQISFSSWIGRKKLHLLFQNLMSSSRKRQKKEVEELEDLYSSLEDFGDKNDVDDGDIMGTIAYATALATT